VDGNRNNALKPGKYADSQQGGAKCGALHGCSDLRRIVELWPDLSDATRLAIRMMAEASYSPANTHSNLK